MSLEELVKKPISVGPWGSQSGSRWDDGVHSGVRQLVIAHGSCIDSIQIEYDKKGSSVWSEKHGGNGNNKIDKIKLGHPEEYLISVHGTYGSMNQWGTVCVQSLTFESNKKTYGPFGVESGTSFSLPMTGSKIVGFHGKCGWYVDSIGVYLHPIQKNTAAPHTVVRSQYNMAHGSEKLGYSVIQGSVGQNYDIVVAFRQKDVYGETGLGSVLTNQDRFGNTRHGPVATNGSAPAITQKNDLGKTAPGAKVTTQSTPAVMQKSNSGKTGPGVLVSTVPSTGSTQVPSTGSIPVPSPGSKLVPSTGSRESSDLGAKDKAITTEKILKKHRDIITYGPWGGTGGSIFDDETFTGIREIKLSRNVGIVSIKVCYDLDGKPHWGSKNGGTGGFKHDKIVFDYPSEILTHITGTYSALMYMGPNAIRSLTFHTNKGRHGPFGEEQGPSFTSKINEGKIIGFHGRGGLFLDAIGVYVKEGAITTFNNAIIPYNSHVAEIDNSPWSNKLVAAKTRGVTEEVACGVVKGPAPCGPGPWGGDGGRQWDDGVFSGIRQIFVTRGEAISSVQFEYDRNGQGVWSVKHGGGGGVTTHRVKLDYPHEVLTCISGYYGPINKDERSKAVKSLTFYTSRGKYGPFGEEIGTYFTSTTTEGKVVGFHGRSSLYLDAIGVHMQHWLGNHKPIKSGFKFF